MDPEFWIKAWNDGRTQFHQPHYNEKLTEYFAQLGSRPGQKVLVPLCGKTKDMLWLNGLGLHVHGIELHDQAARDFFTENSLLSPQTVRDPIFTHYTHGNIAVSCGDFFNFDAVEAFDFVYDRAALVALPRPMRKSYSQVITRSLKKGAKYLLITYEYDPSAMEGPPFSIGGEEIQELYQQEFVIKLMESRRPRDEGARLSSVESLTQNVYILQKK